MDCYMFLHRLFTTAGLGIYWVCLFKSFLMTFLAFVLTYKKTSFKFFNSFLINAIFNISF